MPTGPPTIDKKMEALIGFMGTLRRNLDEHIADKTSHVQPPVPPTEDEMVDTFIKSQKAILEDTAKTDIQKLSEIMSEPHDPALDLKITRKLMEHFKKKDEEEEKPFPWKVLGIVVIISVILTVILCRSSKSIQPAPPQVQTSAQVQIAEPSPASIPPGGNLTQKIVCYSETFRMESGTEGALEPRSDEYVSMVLVKTYGNPEIRIKYVPPSKTGGKPVVLVRVDGWRDDGEVVFEVIWGKLPVTELTSPEKFALNLVR